MKKLLSTNPSSWTALVARVSLGLVIFPHGAQKLLGWFGGYGFNGTMGFFTTQAGLPYAIALLVILIEFFGSLFLIFGFLTRLAAIGFLANFIGAIVLVHRHFGFFMNWTGTQKGEGFEFFIGLFGLVIITLILGGGKASVDAAVTRKNS